MAVVDMKKVLVLILVLSSTFIFAGNRHFYPAKQGSDQIKSQQNTTKLPGYCEIEVINPSSLPVHIEGQYLDGEFLQPFDMYPHQTNQYIVLYYFGCMPGMNLTISGFDGYVYLDGYVSVNSSIIIPERMMGKTVKAKVNNK
jgi:hypothetical protein